MSGESLERRTSVMYEDVRKTPVGAVVDLDYNLKDDSYSGKGKVISHSPLALPGSYQPTPTEQQLYVTVAVQGKTVQLPYAALNKWRPQPPEKQYGTFMAALRAFVEILIPYRLLGKEDPDPRRP